jgi:hypothetical protein
LIARLRRSRISIRPAGAAAFDLSQAGGQRDVAEGEK